jgi:branched-chain amino acid transport system ATP-binding protein
MMLEVTDLHAHYGRAHILQGVSFAIAQGEVLVLLGRNGAGKSTTMKSLIGLLPPSAGRISFAGQNIAGWEPHRIAQAGLGYVPEERRIFTDLTVMENLEVGRQPPHDTRLPWTPERLFALFPNLVDLRDRPAGRVSGGEQQMLAIARTLMGNPSLILLDEPGEGLSPLILDQLADAIAALKREGVTILLTGQNQHFAGHIADRAAIIETGRIVWFGSIAQLRQDEAASIAHLAI